MTVIVCSVGDPETGNSMAIEVDEDFDSVMHTVIPLQQASSALEARQTLTFFSGGSRVFVRPEVVAAIFEGDFEARLR